MKRKIAIAAGSIVAAGALALTGCSGGGEPAASTTDDSTPVTLTLSGWSLSTTPEFQKLADGFHAAHPNVTIEVKEYDAANYNTLLTADLGAGTAPDIITQKEVKYLPVFVDGDQLLDVSDVQLPDGLGGVSSYQVDGKQYAVPYRQDSWVLFYDKDLFDQAGVATPDGSWTWDDFDAAAAKLSASEGKASVYEHTWQSTVQGFASAQADGDIFSGDLDYMKSYYQARLDRQSSGAEVDYNTAKANKLTYQAEFGKQDVALMPMGTWYIATLISQQASGDANAFDWGIAPIPQKDSSTTGTDNTPVTFGDPTGFGINAAIDSSKVNAAKEFLAWAASADAAKILAGIGITPALTSDDVVSAFFGVAGSPTDDLSKFAWSTHDTKPENPTSSDTAAVQTILNTAHDAILSGAQSIDDALKTASDQIKATVK